MLMVFFIIFDWIGIHLLVRWNSPLPIPESNQISELLFVNITSCS